MPRKWRLWIIYILVVTLGMLATVEVALRLTDPDGRGRYAFDGYTQGQQSAADPRGYSLTPGVHQFSNWSATILSDRTRRVPDTTVSSETTIYLIGDSVTFGFGVNDADTWANQLARTCPAVGFVNAGVSGFNSTQVLRNLTVYPGADHYLWLTISNDPEDETIALNGNPFPPTYIGLYLRFALLGATDEAGLRTDPAARWQRYLNEVDAALSDPRVTIITFDDDFGRQLTASRPQVQLIPPYTHFVSPADHHASAAGNQQIAAAVLPIIQSLCE